MNYERFAAHLAHALNQFGNIPEHRLKDGYLPPNNAATLWRQINEGIGRVVDALTAPPPELKFEPFTWRSIDSAPRDRPILVGGRRMDGSAWWQEVDRYDPSTWVDQSPYWTDAPDPPQE
jgi:hypothetical protein